MDKVTVNDRSGFSLPELLAVIAASIIIMGAAIPLVTSIVNHFNLVLAGQHIANEMQYTRMKAVSSNEAFRLRFGPGPNEYQVELENGALHVGPFSLPAGIFLNNVDAGDAISFPGKVVLFLPNGSVPLAGTGSAGRVKLINRAGLRMDIVVDSGGTIRMTPTYKSPPAAF
jgi:hypothetical protein